MKNTKSGCICGIIVGILISTLTVASIASTNTMIGFNGYTLKFNYNNVAKISEDIVAPNGESVPSSIQYTDAAGGVTNYIPLRSITDTLGMDVDLSDDTIFVEVEGRYATMTHNTFTEFGFTSVEKYTIIDSVIPTDGIELAGETNFAEGETYSHELVPNLEDGRHFTIFIENTSETDYLYINPGFAIYNNEERTEGDGKVRFMSKLAPGQTFILTLELSGEQADYNKMPMTLVVGHADDSTKLPISATVSVLQFD